jgi:GNAT superfamily N-acetyltransferase
MRLEDVSKGTKATFLRCLHDERPDDPRVIQLRRRWFEDHLSKGLRAKVLILDTGEVVGLCQYLPIEASHFIGQDLLAILCIWVHGYDHHVGNRQGSGYGRFILEAIEEDARVTGSAGVAAWGMDFPYWNPVSFYEHMGYRRVDQDGQVVLVWKPFFESAIPPQLLHQARRPGCSEDRVAVTVFRNGWCTGGCSQCVMAREAVSGLERLVIYNEIDTSNRTAMMAWGVSDGLYLEGEPYRPYEPPCTSEVLRGDILKRSAEKRAGS